jgi:DNA polymerase/3'-5' exonuclease PolX
MNKKIIDELLKTSKYYESIGDDGRKNAYKKAADSIQQYNRKITSGEQAKQLKWIGDGIAAKIDSILDDDNKVEEEIDNKPSPRVSVTLEKSKSKSNPIKTQSQSRPHFNIQSQISTPIQRQPQTETQSPPEPKLSNKSSRLLRVKQYEYSQKPSVAASVVSRNELAQFVIIAKKAWEKIIHKEDRGCFAIAECCGSYRRGSISCHECVILFKSDAPFVRQKLLFKELIELLKKLRLLSPTPSITHFIDNTNTTCNSILDVSRLFQSKRTGKEPDKPTNIPIVLSLVEQEGWPCALLKWTGPYNYWIQLQSAAAKSGYLLTGDGLYYDNKNGSGKRLYHRDEYDVIVDIGLEYIEPIFRQ